MREGWRRVSKAEPCKVCGHDHGCKESTDGAVGCCLRESQGAFKSSKGWHFHRLKESVDWRRDGQVHGGNGKAARPTGKAYTTAELAIAAAGRGVEGGTLAATWSYAGADGSELMRVARFNLPDGKQFRPVHKAGDGWRIGDPAGLLALYLANDLPDGAAVWVVEGEKCADAARGIGLIAVTSAHGSAAAERSDWTPLAGREVYTLPDHDAPGAKYAADVARILLALEPPARVKVVELPGLPDKGDIVEWLERDGRDCKEPAALRAEIEQLAVAAPYVDASEFVGGPILRCLADVEPVAVNWLWPGRIPLGRITLLVGAPGEGKSFASIDFASRVSTGAPWPDGAECPQGSVILISAEDDPADTIRPRLDAHRADCRKVHLLAAVRSFDGEGKRRERMFTLADLPALEDVLKRVPDCKLIIPDPIGSFIGGQVDGHRDNEVRAVLAPVAALAAKFGPAVLVIAHRRKGVAGSADESALGSRAFTGIARATWHISRDPDNRKRRLMLPGKNNLAPEGDGLAFTIAGDPPSVQWERDAVKMTADDAMEAERDASGPGRPADEREQAKDWLSDELGDGMPHPAADVRKAAHEVGLAWRTVQKAAAELRIVYHKTGFNAGYTWRLPLNAPECAASPKNNNSGALGAHGEIPQDSGDTSAPECRVRPNLFVGENEAHTGDGEADPAAIPPEADGAAEMVELPGGGWAEAGPEGGEQ